VKRLDRLLTLVVGVEFALIVAFVELHDIGLVPLSFLFEPMLEK
jgi:hypothetical protein